MNGGRRRATWGLRGRSMAGTLGLAALAATTALITRAAARRTSRGEGLVVTPAATRLAGRPYREGETLVTTIRVRNPTAAPIRVAAIRTSCSCTVATPEGRPGPPFVLGPGEIADLRMRIGVRADGGPEQSYSMHILSDRGGRTLPDRSATVSFSVEDSLTADPPELAVADVPEGDAVRRRLIIYSSFSEDRWGDLEVRASDPGHIRATIVGRSNETLGPFTRRSEIEAEVHPPPGGGDVHGSLAVWAGGRSLLTIPVRCSFRRPYRLSRDRVIVEGRPGEVVVSEVFVEAIDPRWRDLAFRGGSEGLSAEVESFDASRARIRLTATVPDEPRDGTATFALADGTGEVVIPIRFVLEP